MCEANAYLVDKDGEESLLLEFVDWVLPEDDKTWRLISIFGDQKIIKGKIVRMNLVDHKIIFEAFKDDKKS